MRQHRAVVGAVAGDRVQNPQSAASTQPAQRCRTVETTREFVKGYTVVYRYNGRDITTTLPYDPGPTVRVGVGVVDSASAAGVPAAGMMGSNVREVSRPVSPAYDNAPMPVSTTGNSGGYQYRY